MRSVVFFLFTCLSLASYGQEAATIKILKDARKQRKLSASENIVLLKEGVLFVRLDRQQRRIDYFTKYNNRKEVEKVKAEMLEENRAIIDAFRTYYTFCPVYFFAMEDTRTLVEFGPDDLVFFNDSAQADPAIRPPSDGYFIAEFGYVEQDTTAYWSGNAPQPSHETNPEGKRYYGGSKNTKPALVIFDQQLDQLRDPFPYYSGYTYFGSVKRRYRVPVMKWMEKLEGYYKKIHPADEEVPPPSPN